MERRLSMEAESIRPASGRVGARPVVGSLATGAAGLAGGAIGGTAGIWFASIIVGPVNVEDPWNLFGNAILVLGPLLAMAFGAVVGFVTGAVGGPALLVLGLRWPESGRTIAYLAFLETAAVPLTIWLMVSIGNSLDSTGSLVLWTGALIVGGLTPATARLLASRNLP
jgi:hypothetical protein